jgi:hypothetical protein
MFYGHKWWGLGLLGSSERKTAVNIQCTYKCTNTAYVTGTAICLGNLTSHNTAVQMSIVLYIVYYNMYGWI